MSINWDFPTPRSGIKGVLDKCTGPGATKAELWLQFTVPFLGAIAAPLYAMNVVESWKWYQYILCIFLAFDLPGGLMTTATSSAKRWYHRSGRTFKKHFIDVSIHLIHIVIVTWLYMNLDIKWGLISGGYLLIAATIILLVPLYIQRPIAMLCYAIGLVIALCVLSQPKGLEWFLPLFYLKLLIGYLVKEEPYRPD